MANLLSKFKQNLIADLIDSIDSPVLSVRIDAVGSGYANGESLIFTGDGEPEAAGKVFTTNTGAIAYIAMTEGGNYVVTPNVSVATANGFGAALTAVLDNDHFYVFAARPMPYQPDDNVPEPNFENDYDSFFFMHEQMYFGRKLANNDISFMARTRPWVANTIYTEYDDKDHNFPSSNFYVMTSDNHVFKCIYNNNRAPSLAEPNVVQTEGLPATLSDGYRWKYMYTMTGQDKTKFSTQNFSPVKENPDVVAGAIDGGILNIKVEAGGTNFPVNSGQILSVSGNQIVIAANASAQTNYYANGTITVFGAGNVITNRRITESFQQGNNKIIVVANTFNANQISQGYNYVIGPTLQVVGDGQGFEGYFTMNPANQSIISVEVIDSGNGYNQATATAISGTGFGSGAQLRPIISPKGGHGSDVFGELYCAHVGITGEFANTFQFPTDVTIRTVGLLKNPTANGQQFTELAFNQCANVAVSNTTAQNFTAGETVVGNVSRARGQVAFSNSSLLVITGYTGSFIPGEIINGQSSAVQFTVNAVQSQPEIDVYSGEVLYLQNITPTERSPTSSEQIKLVIRL